MAKDPADNNLLVELNEQQAKAVVHGDEPLLVVAGAGTGKTRTLVHRVAHLIQRGVDPRRILLLTFTRRAAGEMVRRVDALLRDPKAAGAKRRKLPSGQRVWGGTFHAMAALLLRIHGRSIGLDPGFTIHDRADSEDLLNVVRTELDLAKTDRRFPKKKTCLAIYSHCVNAQAPLEDVIERHHRWCQDYQEDLRKLFKGYVDRKDALAVLDYDDLLLFWHGLFSHEAAAERIRGRFDCVLVDEYQDTNRVQAEILRGLCPEGKGLTVVGDDAQSIYSFRAATVRNILDFPEQFPGTTIVKLEENYRSTKPVLEVANRVMAQAREGHAKVLFSRRAAGARPQLIMCEDEYEQADAIIHQVLTHREDGIDMRRQAVLFRASHHSLALETELHRHNIPFVKYGGLKFVEAAHVKDVMAFLRLAENPRDVVAAARVLLLLPGVGPKRAQQWTRLLAEGPDGFQAWNDVKPPAASQELWPQLFKLLTRLFEQGEMELTRQVNEVREFYTPLLQEKYDNPVTRLRDIEQLEEMVARFASRQDMLADMALDPPTSTEDLAGPSGHDDDHLILSTIHSAKGLEWDAVYVLSAIDGNIPSGMAVDSPEQVEEERRLFYVALTRAKSWLYVFFPQRRPRGWRGGYRDDYGYAQLTRFITSKVKKRFECNIVGVYDDEENHRDVDSDGAIDIRQRSRSMWS